MMKDSLLQDMEFTTDLQEHWRRPLLQGHCHYDCQDAKKMLLNGLPPAHFPALTIFVQLPQFSDSAPALSPHFYLEGLYSTILIAAQTTETEGQDWIDSFLYPSSPSYVHTKIKNKQGNKKTKIVVLAHY